MNRTSSTKAGLSRSRESLFNVVAADGNILASSLPLAMAEGFTWSRNDRRGRVVCYIEEIESCEQ